LKSVETFTKILTKIKERNPELRIGQIVVNAKLSTPSLFNISDEFLIKLMKEYQEELTSVFCPSCKTKMKYIPPMSIEHQDDTPHTYICNKCKITITSEGEI